MITATASRFTWGAIAKASGDLMWIFPTEEAAREFSAACPIPTIPKPIEWRIDDPNKKLSEDEMEDFFAKLKADLLQTDCSKRKVMSCEERIKFLLDEAKRLKTENEDLQNTQRMLMEGFREIFAKAVPNEEHREAIMEEFQKLVSSGQ